MVVAHVFLVQVGGALKTKMHAAWDLAPSILSSRSPPTTVQHVLCVHQQGPHHAYMCIVVPAAQYAESLPLVVNTLSCTEEWWTSKKEIVASFSLEKQAQGKMKQPRPRVQGFPVADALPPPSLPPKGGGEVAGAWDEEM